MTEPGQPSRESRAAKGMRRTACDVGTGCGTVPAMEMDGGSAPVPVGLDADVPPQEAWAEAADRGRDAGSDGRVRRATGTKMGPAHLPVALLQQLIDAARDGYPNEACGILVGVRTAAEGGPATRFEPMRNAAASPYRYYLGPTDLLRVVEIEDAGEQLWGIFHSHVGSPAEPSATDIGLAQYPDALSVICSLAGEVPTVRAWSIRDGVVREVTLSVG